MQICLKKLKILFNIVLKSIFKKNIFFFFWNFYIKTKSKYNYDKYIKNIFIILLDTQ